MLKTPVELQPKTDLQRAIEHYQQQKVNAMAMTTLTVILFATFSIVTVWFRPSPDNPSGIVAAFSLIVGIMTAGVTVQSWQHVTAVGRVTVTVIRQISCDGPSPSQQSESLPSPSQKVDGYPICKLTDDDRQYFERLMIFVRRSVTGSFSRAAFGDALTDKNHAEFLAIYRKHGIADVRPGVAPKLNAPFSSTPSLIIQRMNAEFGLDIQASLNVSTPVNWYKTANLSDGNWTMDEVAAAK